MFDYVEANGLASVVLHKANAMGVDYPVEAHTRLERIEERLIEAASEAERWKKAISVSIAAEAIPQYWLKGAAWGRSLYGGLGIRPMRDLDLIVPAGDVLRADEIVSNLGFVRDTFAGVAAQHLPRRVHPLARVKVDIHHRLLPHRIYGFPVTEPEVPWGPSDGLIEEGATSDDVYFHVAHMLTHIFHHSFYNLRLLHLFDVRLAQDKWGLSSDEIVDIAALCMPRTIAADFVALVDELFGSAPGASVGRLRPHWVDAFKRSGSTAVGYPLVRIPSWRDALPVTRAELRRIRFVLLEAPGRFGRARASLHPPE